MKEAANLGKNDQQHLLVNMNKKNSSHLCVYAQVGTVQFLGFFLLEKVDRSDSAKISKKLKSMPRLIIFQSGAAE